MNLVFATDCRFEKCLDGKIYSPDGTVRAQLWQRYLSIFDKVIIIGRVVHSQNISYHTDFLAESENVSFIELPNYKGLFNFLVIKKKINEIVKKESIFNRAYICRVPGVIGRLMAAQLYKRRIPYAVEVVGDPWDVFAPGVVKHPLRPLIRLYFYRTLRDIVNKASASLYVTKNKLQERYPFNIKTFSTYASDVVLPVEKVASVNLFNKDKNSEINIISVGSLAQMYKAPDIVLNALKILKDKDWKLRLTWIGDGKFKEEMKILGAQLGLTNNINFVGSVSSGVEVKNHLVKADLFLLVSRTEGLPRAIIEAMSVGLPCIGSYVGGIPELLDDIALVESGNVKKLADKIEQFISDKTLMNKEGIRNLKESENYVDSVLQAKRIEFYTEIKRFSNNDKINKKKDK